MVVIIITDIVRNRYEGETICKCQRVTIGMNSIIIIAAIVVHELIYNNGTKSEETADKRTTKTAAGKGSALDGKE